MARSPKKVIAFPTCHNKLVSWGKSSWQALGGAIRSWVGVLD
jgi:hypothetical protein